VKSDPSSESNPLRPRIRSTTVLAVRRAGHVVIGGDGQVTMGNTVVKGTARKVRRPAPRPKRSAKRAVKRTTRVRTRTRRAARRRHK